MSDSSKQQTSESKPESPLSPKPSNGSGVGEGVDRRIEKKTFTPKRIAVGVALLLFVAFVGYGVWSAASGGQRLSVEREKLTVSTAEEGPFQEFIAVTGNVLPERTVYLEAVSGGRVEDVFAESGEMVEEDEPILRLSNPDLQMQLMQSEAQLSEQTSRLENMRFQVEQSRLSLRQQLAEMDYQIQRLQREHERQQQLYEKDLIAEREYQETRDELEYWQRRRELTRRTFQQDSLAQTSRLDQMTSALEGLRNSFQVMQDRLDNLTVRAPISGQLSSLNPEVGEILSSGERLGQVDVLDSFKVRAQIDEFYIERVHPGQTATTESIGGERYEMRTTRIYPEVENGRFRVDLQFVDGAPESIRRGQSLRLRLELGSSEQALLLPRGGFYQSTGGNWAYVLTEGGGEAVRRPIRIGRQNPEYFEVLEGLEPGERVVTSSYETFGDADRLVLE